MQAKYSPETSDFQQTTWRYISENGTFLGHRYENLKSYKCSKIVLCTSSAYYVANVKEEINFSVDADDDVNFLVFRKLQVAWVREQNAGMSRRRGSLLLGSGGWATHPTCMYIEGWVRRLLGWFLASGSEGPARPEVIEISYMVLPSCSKGFEAIRNESWCLLFKRDTSTSRLHG
jgi:hypothetical protein